jgi:hypothetical protein
MQRLFLVTLLLAGCSGTSTFNTDPDSDGQIPIFDRGAPWERPLKAPDATCGGQTVPITLVQKGDIPDLFLVVDRSGSMIMPIDLFNWALGSKWDVMRKTLQSLVDAYRVNIRFGLSTFPANNDCAPGTINVPLANGNWQTVQSALNIGADGNTPTAPTLAAVRSYLSTVTPGPGARYVLLATDGMPNCGATSDTETGPETLAEVQKLASDGVKTFVLGFGEIAAGDPTLLNQLAAAGGVPNPKGPQFYPASNETQLKNALFGIAGGIIPPPCTYSLTAPPQDPDKVTVTFDGVAVPRSQSSTQGWNYTSGGTEITFFGAACDQLRSGQIKQVQFIFGCKGPVVS